MYYMPERLPNRIFNGSIDKLKRAADDAFFEHENSESKMASCWEALNNKNERKLLRVKALFALCRSVLPDTLVDTLTKDRYAYSAEQMPIDFEQYEFEERVLDVGGESRIYKLVSRNENKPSLVIKIYLKADSTNTEELLARAAEVREDHIQKKEWYHEIPEFVPEEFHFIATAPQGGKPALYTLQEFYGGEYGLRDFFRNFSISEVLSIAQTDTQFREQLMKFIDITLLHAEENEMIDTLGKNNVILVQGENGHRLILLDTHSTVHPESGMIYNNQANKDLEYLRSIKQKISQFK
jgi:predicted DNA-binding protein (MmcQ/YjbR family)